MRAVLLCPLLLVAACAAPTAKDLERMSTAEVCYLGATQPENRQMAATEVQRRKANCEDYVAEMNKMQEDEIRRRMGEGVGPTQRPMGGGGMGRY